MSWSAKQFCKKYGFLILVLAITFIGCVAWQTSTWYLSDDYVYMHPSECVNDDSPFWSAESQTQYTAEVAVDSSINHWKYVNGRLANIIYIWCQLVPRQLVNFLNGTLMFAILLLLMAFATNRREVLSKKWFAIWCVAILWLFPTWHDTMQSSVYQVNYTWTTVICLIYIVLFNKCALDCTTADSSHGKSSKILIAILLTLFSFIAGWMHEGFSVCVIAYVGIRILFYKKWRAPLTWVMAISFFLGFVFATSPGTFHRLGMSSAFQYHLLQYNFTKYMRELWPVYVTFILLCVACRRIKHAGGNAKAFIKEIAPYIIAIATGIAMALTLVIQGRGLWGTNIFAALIAVRSLSIIFANPVGIQPRSKTLLIASNSVAYLALVGYVVWLCQLVSWQRVITSEQRWIDSQIASVPTGCIYYTDSIHHNEELPWYLRDLVSHRYYHNSMSNFMQASSMSACKKRFTAVLPDSLRDAKFEDLPKIPGQNPFRGAFPEMLSDRLYYSPKVYVTLGKPADNYSPLQTLQSMILNRRNPYTSHDTIMVKLMPHPVTDSHGRLLIKYYFEMMPYTYADREIISVDIIDNPGYILDYTMDDVMRILNYM